MKLAGFMQLQSATGSFEYDGKKVQSTQQMVGVIYLFIATCFGRFWPSSGNNIDKLA
jgi:hypothetical protein